MVVKIFFNEFFPVLAMRWFVLCSFFIYSKQNLILITLNPYRRQGTLLIQFLVDILAQFAYNKMGGKRIITEQVLELSLQTGAFS